MLAETKRLLSLSNLNPASLSRVLGHLQVSASPPFQPDKQRAEERFPHSRELSLHTDTRTQHHTDILHVHLWPWRERLGVGDPSTEACPAHARCPAHSEGLRQRDGLDRELATCRGASRGQAAFGGMESSRERWREEEPSTSSGRQPDGEQPGQQGAPGERDPFIRHKVGWGASPSRF